MFRASTQRGEEKAPFCSQEPQFPGLAHSGRPKPACCRSHFVVPRSPIPLGWLHNCPCDSKSSPWTNNRTDWEDSDALACRHESDRTTLWALDGGRLCSRRRILSPGAGDHRPPLTADCSGGKKKLRLWPASQIFAPSCCRSRWRWRQARSSWAPRARSPKTRRFIGSASGPPSSLSLFLVSKLPTFPTSNQSMNPSSHRGGVPSAYSPRSEAGSRKGSATSTPPTHSFLGQEKRQHQKLCNSGFASSEAPSPEGRVGSGFGGAGLRD